MKNNTEFVEIPNSYYFSGIGPNFGKKATWIGAAGDQTFFKIDESLITGPMLTKVNIVADKNTIRMYIVKRIIKCLLTFSSFFSSSHSSIFIVI